MDIAAASPILVVKSSRVKLLWLVVLFGCLLLMAMSALPSIAGWFATVILGLLFPVVLYIYRPSATFLRLHVNGLDISTAGRQRTIDWADVARFNIGANSGGKNIAIDYRHDLMIWNHPSRTPDADSEWIRDLYAMPLEQLCITLNCWRARRSSSAAHERGGISNLSPHLPLNATDDELLQFVDGWVRLLENEDYTAAFYYTTHYPSDQWTPDLMRAVVKGYGESNPAQKVTLHGKPTETWQRKEVSCRDEPEFGAVGNVWYDLNIEGDLSDLTATFTIYKNAKGFIVVLEQIHLM